MVFQVFVHDEYIGTITGEDSEEAVKNARRKYWEFDVVTVIEVKYRNKEKED